MVWCQVIVPTDIESQSSRKLLHLVLPFSHHHSSKRLTMSPSASPFESRLEGTGAGDTPVKKRRKGATRLSCAECRRWSPLAIYSVFSANLSAAGSQAQITLRSHNTMQLLREAWLWCHLSRRMSIRLPSQRSVFTCFSLCRGRLPPAKEIGELG